MYPKPSIRLCRQQIERIEALVVLDLFGVILLIQESKRHTLLCKLASLIYLYLKPHINSSSRLITERDGCFANPSLYNFEPLRLVFTVETFGNRLEEL